jgi:hypothetical protein
MKALIELHFQHEALHKTENKTASDFYWMNYVIEACFILICAMLKVILIIVLY